MSTSITAAVIYGISLSRSEYVKQIPNEFYGKYPFDPFTGNRPTQFTEKRLPIIEAITANKLASFEDRKQNQMIFGLPICAIDDYGSDGLDPFVRDLRHTASQAIRKVLLAIDVDLYQYTFEPRLFLILDVS